MTPQTCRRSVNCWGVTLLLLSAAGCQLFPRQSPPTEASPPVQGADGGAGCVPRELRKTVLPPYVIEPPDLLLIDAFHVVPKQPYHLQPYDTVTIQVVGTPAEAPIAGIYPIGADGSVTLGSHYGSVYLWGKTISEAKDTIAKQLAAVLVNADVTVSLADSAARQRISGPHLVGMDGTVTLGSYGSVCVVGLTVAQAKLAVQQFLLQYFESLDVSLEVNGYNSKVYYIVTQGAGFGDGVYRFPITGNETVLDAVSQINGLRPVSSTRIWIARPTDNIGTVQRFEVSWHDITANGNACSNYQILPGDRVYIAENQLIALDTNLGKIMAPIERVMGFSLFGVGVATRFSGNVLAGGGNTNATF